MGNVGMVGSVPEPVRQALSSAGFTLIEGDKADIVLVRVKGDWPVVSKGCFVIALCDLLADAGPAYRAGAHAVVPLDPEVVCTLALRVRNERSVRRLADLERDAILMAIKASAGNTARAAAMLDISVRKVQYKLHEYGVPLSRKSPRNGTHQ